PDLDKDLPELVIRGVAPSRAARFATARDYQTALLAWAKNAEHRGQLLAEFLDRPKMVRFVPTPVPQPPRPRPAGSEDNAPPPRPRGGGSDHRASTAPVSREPLPAERGPPLDERHDGEPPRAHVDAGAPSAAPSGSKARAIVVGAAVGVASAVALYEAFR